MQDQFEKRMRNLNNVIDSMGAEFTGWLKRQEFYMDELNFDMAEVAQDRAMECMHELRGMLKARAIINGEHYAG